MTSVQDFIISAADNFFCLPAREEQKYNEDALNDFIYNPHTLLLQIFIKSDQKFAFYTKIQGGVNKCLIFYKTSAIDLNSLDAINYINIITMTTDAAESLYQILRQIYSPLLAIGEDLYSSKLQKNILDLESNLRILTNGKDHENIGVILCIEDEIEYWKAVGLKKDTNKKERETASFFSILFEDICEEIRSLQSSSLQEIRDSAENIAAILDDVWRYTTLSYSEDRMMHIFDIIGHIVCSVIQKAASHIDLWETHDSTNDNAALIFLSEALNIVKTWINACKSLTETYWPNYALHPWKGKPYISIFCSNFEARLKEILNIRSTYNQLTKLLTKNEKEELNSDGLLKHFKDINIWICNGPNQSWESASSRFAADLRPAEAKIAEKLKPRMHNTTTKQMLYEFIRYKSLINRPLVKHALSNELELFVGSLLSMLKSIHNALDSDQLDVDVKMHRPAELSPLVQQVQWAKQMEAKVTEIHTCTEKYLNDFDNSVEVLNLSSQVLKDLKTMYTQLHEDWARDVQAQLKDGSLQLSGDKPVVEFSASDRLMVVRFEPRLVRVESEARALAALGLPLPPTTTSSLQAFTAPLKHARALHQVASFHNTLGERMIPSTRPMMLQAALELASLVQDHQPLYWHLEEQLINFTDKLKQIVLKLEGQNTYLTGQHLAIRSKVEKLMDTELLAEQSEWKRGIKEIRDIIEKAEVNGYKNTDMWRLHWDLQLYKAMECQYIKTLLSLQTHFPNVRVDLVLRGRSVCVQPPIEEIRVQHYSQLRRLVSLPNHFTGLHAKITDDKSIFASIVDKHSWLGNKAVAQLESALANLHHVCTKWTKNLALACVDLDALCAEHLKKPSDWEWNFKACKSYGQAVAKMTFDDEKIEWITVGTFPLRREFEAQARNLWAALMSSLQASCRDDTLLLDSFMANALVTLENRTMPKNAKELAEVSAKQQALQEKMPEMEKTVEDLKRKSHLLRTWGCDSSLENTVREWQQLREQIQVHHQMFEHQAEIVKTSLKGEWENLHNGIEALVSRWNQTKPRLEDTRDVTYTEMVDRCRSVFDAVEHFNKFETERNELMLECEKFNLNIESSEVWKEAENLKAELLNIWSKFKTYNDDYETIAEQEWIVFQKKLHLLDDFIYKWNGLLEPFTSITLYLKQELDRYTELTAALKYLRGSDFTETHWREVFGLLQMEYIESDALQLKHFLNVANYIKKQMKALQKISTSASSEAAIRTVLNELEIWYASARLVIIYYTDKSEKLTPIIKDYKDLLTKIEEQQWVVSSVGGSAYMTCATWEARLRTARNLVRAAHHAQRRWLYLEPILSKDDGELGVKFRKVEKGFKQVSRIIESDPRLSTLVQSTRLQPMLDSISEQLNACQSALNQYIDAKRLIFPRLYFLSDDDLLEILGQARAGTKGRDVVLQSHLKKLFPGITGVNLGPQELSITALCSYEETFQLDHPVDIDCAVEMWLKNLEQEIRSSLQNMALKCLVSYNLRDQDPFLLPTQILCLSQNIRFTEKAERAITSKELHKLKDNLDKESLYYAAAEVENDTEKFKKQALILQCAFYVSVVQELIEHNVVAINDWCWQKQLRFYLQNSKEIIIRMGLAEISYSYEYLGVNTGQFVRTETTDESFLILIQSIHLGQMGNPFGPAGTGKTESVKALGALVGRLVLVFNCDEAMDAECMGRLLTGVALCGAWGCFDEFNRLSANTLAAISHQLVSLLAATRKDSTSEHMALLNGKQVRVSEWCGVAATMNPAGRGYGGRRALPPALLHALRPLALRPPSRYILSARLLAARATFSQLLPGQLAADLDNVFTLASTLLSDQKHYDWGLRALKSAVGSCGNALNTRGPCSEIEQRTILRNVLRLNNLSKLTIYDAERFENILNMIFANVPNEKTKVEPLYDSLTLAVKKLDLVHNKLQIQKCIELYEQLQQRMGVVIVGPPGSGKSTIRQLLKSALSLQGKNVMEYVIYPKAMSRSWLLGHIEQDTRQWTDGVFSTVALELSNQNEDVWSWVVCDGDVDPEWIEALNSVLDDNRLLTLPSGWRVQFGPNVNFIFETHSLEYASPATISRMGIILLSSEKQCSEEVLESWTQKKTFENETSKMAIPFLNEIVKKFLRWISLHRSDLIIKDCCISLVKQILVQFENIIQETNSRTPSNEEDIVWSAVHLSVISLLKSNAIDSFYEELQIPRLLHQETHDVEWADTLLRSSRIQACEPALRAAVLGNNDVIVIGPDASAKNLLAEYVLKETNSNVITIDCNPILEPEDIIAELKRKNAINGSGVANVGSLGNAGGNFRILLVRGLDRVQRDQWGSCRIHYFILQLMQQNGFWAREEGIPQWYSGRFTIIATASTSIQSPRLAAYLSPIILSEPDEDELLELLRTYLLESFAKNITDKDISHLSRNMLSFYKELTNNFHSKPHYKWNPSHLKKWCENIKWYSPSNLDEVIMALNAEANILFKERLVTYDEKSNYNKIVQNYLRAGDDVYFKQRLRSDGIYLEAVEYEEWYKSTQKLINQCLTDDEYIFGDPGIDVCDELSTLSMAIALTLNGGVLTCIGSAGVGRRQAARLVTTALSATLVNIDQQAQFYTMFKNALTSASEGIRTLVVISESVANGQWLACIEAFLKADSLQVLSSNIVPTSQPQTSQSLINIKLNLGIMICLDKEQDNLSTLLDSYPLLCNNRLMWLEQWSSETLRQMPSLLIQRLSKYNGQEMSQEDLSSIPIEGFLQVYKNLEAKIVCVPVKYLHFIKAYYYIFSTKKQTLLQRLHTLSAGVEALRSARSEVATLQAEAAQQETALSEEQFKANQALDQIGATVRATTDKKEEMHQLKKNIEMENEKLQVRKKEIEAELASVEPVIAAARAAVGDIRPESLSEVRSLRAPPDVVRDVLEGVLRLMGIADTSWHSMKSFLSKRGVKEDIRCLDASQISSEAAQSVERLLERRGASFEQATAKRASAACAPLAAWVLANLAYARALSRVRPLQEQQRHLHKNLQHAENELAALSSGLATVDERVAALKEQLGQHTREAATIEIRVRATTDTINAARDLLDQLAQEYDSWETHLQSISQEILNLNDRSLLAAAYLTYLPDLTESQARNYLLKWSELIGFTETSFSVINFLSSPEKQLKWEVDGLPLDQSAIKNAISIDQYLGHGGPLIPLVIDPEGEAETWLRGTLHQSSVDFVAQHSDNLYTALQLAVRLGRQLVITDVDSIEEWWWVMVRGGRARVVLVTRSTLAAAPCVLSYLAPLHFAPRLHALVDQMIYYAMQKQNPEMNKKTREIKHTKATLQKQQYELQEHLLKDLTSNGNILHDANLLASLKKTRITSSTITEALLAAKAIEEETRAAYDVYEESATRAATLSLAVKQLALRHPLISLPMDAVFEMFENAVSRVGGTKDINNDKVVKNFTRRIIERVLLSMHKKDKYTVVMHLLHNAYENLIPEKLWNLFIGNFNLMVDKNVLIDIENKCKWATDCIRKIAQIKTLDEDFFVRLNIEKYDFWLEFKNSGDLHFINRLNLSPFEVVVAVAAVRPDSTYRAVIAFVDQLLGSGVMRGDYISRSVQWARATRPVLLLAAHAVDALTAYALASSRTITMVGVEEGLAAWNAAFEASRGWLAITVGASPFTRDLTSFVVSLSQRSISEFNDDFRLWITAEDREIPSTLANTCVCIVIESPEGVKRNACGTLQSWSRDPSDASMSRLLARLALLHALIQERRNYIPLGWSRYYAWEWGDVSTSAAAVRRVGGGDASRELCGSLYAARVEAPADREVLRALLARCMLDPLAVFDGLSRTANMQDYITALESLPDIDPPQLLELPNNCRVAWEHNAAENIIHGLRELNTTVSIKKSDTTTPLKTLLSLWKKLMSGSPLIKPDYRIEKKLYGWWGAVCAAEAHDAATAARTLHVTLAALAHSRQAASVYKVPEEWQLLWSGPDTPEEYIEEFCMRARAAIERIKMYDFIEDYMPQEVDLRLFLRPQRILTAARVHAAGKRACDLRQMALTVKWNCSNDESEGIIVTGVNVSGAVWTGSLLVAAQEGDAPHSPAPPLLFRYLPKDTDAGFESSFSIPLYASATRETQLERVRAPLHSQYSSRTATLHAVALFVAPTHGPA